MPERESVIILVSIVAVLGVLVILLLMNLPGSPGALVLPSCQTQLNRQLSDGLIFNEDFDSGLSAWELHGHPQPAIDMNRGTPAPSFNNRGDDLI